MQTVKNRKVNFQGLDSEEIGYSFPVRKEKARESLDTVLGEAERKAKVILERSEEVSSAYF